MGRTLKANSSTGEGREPIKPGAYKAILVGFANVGHQDGPYGTKEQCIVTWEVQKKGEVVGQLSKFYTYSFNVKATLRQDVESMLGRAFKDGEEFDPESLLDIPCRLSIVNEVKGDRTRDKISSLMPLDEDDTPVKAQGNAWFYEVPLSGSGFEIPGDLPDWIANRVRQSHEYTGASEPVGAGITQGPARPDDDEIPY